MGEVPSPPEPEWTDRAAVIDYQVASQRAVVTPAFDRTPSPEPAEKNHYATEGAEGEPAAITAPTLVPHGTEDPMFPLAHGEALAREIPGARLVALAHTGHEFPRENWPLVPRELIAHTA